MMIGRLLRAVAVSTALVAGTAGASLAEDVVFIPSRAIYPGETVTASLLRQVVLKPDRRIPPAVSYRLEDLEGKVARRTLLPKRYIPTSSLREAYLVEQGAPVRVVYEAGSLEISATAICLESGSAGDFVRVRNVDSGKILSGVVANDGTVRVGA
ncbi:MAG: flagellar basal body P-ring formation chaperone FlgA [Rhizobiaceae bacterium]